ncbi:MAG: hypothetical protein AAB527_00170 [Patescibacteria group bacterium]
MPTQVQWHKYHGIPKFPIEIGLGSSFPTEEVFSFGESLRPPKQVMEKMIYRALGSQTSDKAYLPAVHVFANFSEKLGTYDSGSLMFAPFIVSPEAKHHQLELHRKDKTFVVCGRHGEQDAFGFSVSDRGDPNYLRLAFPNETDKFPDTFILIERREGEDEGGESKYDIIKFTSDFAKPDKFVVGKPVVVNWEVVDLASAPDCLKKAVEDRIKNAENEAKAAEQALSAFARRRGLTRQ